MPSLGHLPPPPPIDDLIAKGRLVVIKLNSFEALASNAQADSHSGFCSMR